jgi:hypothetical protein
MKSFPLILAAAFCFSFSPLCKAQSTGRVECPRSDGYIYLYSSTVTLDVRTTLQCNEVVQITGRYETYFAVRTSKGDTGYVPLSNLVVLKDQPGSGVPQPAAPPISRERTPYDARPQAPPPSTVHTAPPFALVKDTPVRVRILKAVSSANAHAGDTLEFEVLGDVLVDGVVVITKGSMATGSVVVAEPKKHFGRDGKLAFNINSIRLADNEQAPVRCFHETSGAANSSSSSVVPLGSGKDATVPQGAEFTALVDGDVHLKREAFGVAKDASASPPASPTTTDSSQPPR